MSYLRVIPRDLFNEGNLLKCLGRVYINLEKLALERLLEHDGEPFDIDQDENSGALFASNVRLAIRGEWYGFYRSLNSRFCWPLKLTVSDNEEIDVFDETTGEFSAEMMQFLGSVHE